MTLTEVSTQLNSINNNKLPPIFFLTDMNKFKNPEVICQQLPTGSGVIFRDYEISDRKLRASTLAKVCAEHGLILFIGEDRDLALSVGADGVHYKENTITSAFKSMKDKKLIVTAATHTFNSILMAKEAGADAVLLSPVFRTKSHPEATPLGISKFRDWTNRSPLPVYALGGISSDNAHKLLSTKAIGIAAIEGVIREFYPSEKS
ncbi:MAG: thiamine monophosphate synthase [Alphaproteobacteria bacterium]|nr:thiamine monophosphate synthase [Alphaproteobacteria bacterium]|tara:strand:+ start:2092 stop:2706 length:615 start_codon:yes stop_codon:yes gene_type:complete